MKIQGTCLFKNLSEEQLQQLTKEVKETVICETKCTNLKNFSSIDLWNIRRRKSTLLQRRNLI